ncbi:transposase, partial [Mycobacterium tuberculosis M2007]
MSGGSSRRYPPEL